MRVLSTSHFPGLLLIYCIHVYNFKDSVSSHELKGSLLGPLAANVPNKTVQFLSTDPPKTKERNPSKPLYAYSP